MEDPFRLERFVLARQETWAWAPAELRAGAKRTHWMWFTFPQIRGLGTSAMAARYGIDSLDEARAYLAHPVLGPRLRELTGIVLEHEKPVGDIFPYPDNLKLKSSLTLFHQAAPEESLFAEALFRCFGGRKDWATLELLGRR